MAQCLIAIEFVLKGGGSVAASTPLTEAADWLVKENRLPAEGPIDARLVADAFRRYVVSAVDAACAPGRSPWVTLGNLSVRGPEVMAVIARVGLKLTPGPQGAPAEGTGQKEVTQDARPDQQGEVDDQVHQ